MTRLSRWEQKKFNHRVGGMGERRQGRLSVEVYYEQPIGGSRSGYLAA